MFRSRLPASSRGARPARCPDETPRRARTACARLEPGARSCGTCQDRPAAARTAASSTPGPADPVPSLSGTTAAEERGRDPLRGVPRPATAGRHRSARAEAGGRPRKGPGRRRAARAASRARRSSRRSVARGSARPGRSATSSTTLRQGDGRWRSVRKVAARRQWRTWWAPRRPEPPSRAGSPRRSLTLYVAGGSSAFANASAERRSLGGGWSDPPLCRSGLKTRRHVQF